MQPVFFFQFLMDIRYATILDESNIQRNDIGKDLVGFEKWRLKIRDFFHLILENRSMRLLAFLLQISGIVGFIVFVAINANVRNEILLPALVLPLSIPTISIVWSNKVQEYLAIPAERSKGTSNAPFSARYKASEFYSEATDLPSARMRTCLATIKRVATRCRVNSELADNRECVDDSLVTSA